MEEKEKAINFYNEQTRKNLDDIEEILDSLKMESPTRNNFKQLFQSSSVAITTSWEKERKYCRTIFVKTAFGKQFPDHFLGVSLSLDVMINILDDLLDEELSPEKKTAYIIEFLRNFANYSHQELSSEIRNEVGLYFNKLITLAISEKVYEEEIKKSNALNKIAGKSVDLLICRGMDIDIFSEIALIDYAGNADAIRKNARAFRAMNILKKDIIDIPYDLKNNMESVVTLVQKKDFDFLSYISQVLSIFDQKIEVVDDQIASNFLQMIQKQKKEIIKLAKSA